MAWIELHQAVWTHRKTFELAAALDLSETYAAAHLLRLWCWALDNAPDGNLTDVSDRAIARGADWSGEPEAFVAALTQAGWLDADRAIHDWEQYAGRLIDRREANAERMRKARANRVSPDKNARAENVQRTCDESVQLPDLTGPNRTLTGPNQTPTPKSPPHGGGDLAAAAAATNGDAKVRPSRRGATAVLDAPPSPDDQALWDLAVEQIAGEDSGPNWAANVEANIKPLTVAGRGPTGGLQLRAPPGSRAGAQRFRQTIVVALNAAGDPMATHVAIVD